MVNLLLFGNKGRHIGLQTDGFLIVDIQSCCRIKKFSIYKVDGKWLIIKADEEEKEVILSKMNEKITFISSEKEPFDLRKLR